MKRRKYKDVDKQITETGKLMRRLGLAGGASAGAAFGPLGMAVGGVVGGGLAGLVSQWTGNGDYRVSQNSIMTKASSSNSIPNMHKNSQSVTIRHREFIGTISGSVGFQVQLELPINPGMDQTFPWLAPIAARFQQFEIKGMVYHYVPTSGIYSPDSSAIGAIMMQTTYRTTDAPPVSKIEMLNEYWATESIPSSNFIHPIECNPKENPFNVHYVRNTPITSGEPLMYDLGKTFVATQGCPSSSDVLGDLWVTYEVVLKKPLISSSVVNSNKYVIMSFSGGSISKTNFFSNNTVTTYYGDSSEFTFANRSITFPISSQERKYVVNIAAIGGYSAGACSFDGSPAFSPGTTGYNYNGSTAVRGTTITGGTAAANTLFYEFGVVVDAGPLAWDVDLPAIVSASGAPTMFELQINEVD